MDQYQFEAIGTRWRIESASPIDAALRAAVEERIRGFDETYSRFRADSLVTRASAVPGRYEFPEDAEDLFSFYDALDAVTDGAVNPLVGSALDALGYGPGYRLVPEREPGHVRPPRWREAVAREGTVLTTAPGAGVIDVGAAGKGYLVDLVCELLVAAGHLDVVVDAGGDLRRVGDQIEVALENPFDPTQAIGIVQVADPAAAICGSAVNRRRWAGGLHHVLDGRTGIPASRVVATWAVAPTALIADGIATALFFTEPVLLEALADISWIRVFADGTLTYSDTLPGEIFERES